MNIKLNAEDSSTAVPNEHVVQTKLMRFEVPNRIIDDWDWDSKLIDRQLTSIRIPTIKMESTIVISI